MPYRWPVASERSIPVRAGTARYEVVVQAGLLDRLGPLLAKRLPCTRAAVVADAHVAPLYLDRVRASLQEAGIEALPVVIPAGEAAKSFDTLRLIYDAILPAGIERSTPMLALGGGMTTDLAGFAAATMLRGVPFVPVPTSLLGMVDASVGGKTGINHATGKNLIGAFHQPALVLMDPATLTTLPPRELRNGLAEVIKHYIIRDARGFARFEARVADALRPDVGMLTETIAENVAIKTAFVEADPHEQGVRAHLNFGHTFGHALEKVTGYALPHGEAVALGMCCAMHAGVEMGLCQPATRDRVAALIASAELPTRVEGIDVDAAIAAMWSDKKVKAGKLRFILTERIGSVIVRDDVPEPVVRGALASICR